MAALIATMAGSAGCEHASAEPASAKKLAAFTGAAPNAGLAAGPTAQAVSTRASPAAAATPRPERNGLDAKVVWTARQPEAQVGCVKTYDELAIKECRADGNWLYLDVAHDAVVPAAEHPGAAPELALRRNDCPYTAPRVSGTVWRDWASPSTLIVALAELPDGDLDIAVRAFGVEGAVLLRKMGKAVRSIRDEERENVEMIPADPVHGLPLRMLVHDPDCSEEVAR